ncbi:hypothetical protein GCM10025867_12020 [Frondihabitans sucicola]|uniref:D-glucuronyl C5-epimerase C-terminal domain-containing protein n=1 Tax=Frondihabitans sucicola TaxID=1268041 RepID=A0ABM8GKN6_9MICO|nr:hypothetical protein [Frondihabitans sucicola]BDZ48961.1 hypothetical protein GCM10025867_12020 [Frondihabitans sucicola]
MTNLTTSGRRRVVAAIAAAALVSGLGLTAAAPALAASPPAAAAPARLTDLAHLDFLLDRTAPKPVAGHTTYALDSQPTLTMPWVYADARPGGTFQRVGGGPLDPATGHWGQGSYDADDVSRAAVVYLRDWQQTGSATSRQKAYELLRSTAYFQTTTGPDAGNVVLWMQPDGTLNPSPVPVELPNPSDSGNSYWLARSLWAFGEGYAAFHKTDPAFAAFLQQRIQLGVKALDRETLSSYGKYSVADGVRVPSWLIVGGADASAEAVLGLSAYSAAAPNDRTARSALSHLSEGIAAMGSKQSAAVAVQSWPYGAILPGTTSRSQLHSWASQMPEALARASVVLKRPALLKPAVTDSVAYSTTLLTSTGPINGFSPTPTDTTQIAYGADSRLQSLLAVADASHSRGIEQLAGLMGSWYFGNNTSGKPTYDPATGVTFDGVQPDGTVNTGSGAESTIHGLLSMLALDAHPAVSALAQASSHAVSHDGLSVVEAEKAVSTTGTIVTPTNPNDGESQVSGGSELQLDRGDTARFVVPADSGARHVDAVIAEPTGSSAVSSWPGLGLLRSSVGAQGVTPVAGALLPQALPVPLAGRATSASVRAVAGTTTLDALILRPLVSRVKLSGAGSSATELAQSTSLLPQRTTIGSAGSTVRVYDDAGRLVQTLALRAPRAVLLPAGGFAVATR